MKKYNVFTIRSSCKWMGGVFYKNTCSNDVSHTEIEPKEYINLIHGEKEVLAIKEENSIIYHLFDRVKDTEAKFFIETNTTVMFTEIGEQHE